jgi:NAD(P)H-hydrate epimerase
VTHHGEALRRESGDASLAGAVASGDLARLTPRMQVLCRYAIELTRSPWTLREEDLVPLRAVGLDDRGIVDANQVVAYFNYVTRIAHGLGVELETHWDGREPVLRPYGLARPTAPLPCVEAAALPWISVAQMREVDRIMTDELGIPLEQMMENAGRSLAALARWYLGGDVQGRRVRILVGPGGNGGGGMVAARHLTVAGAIVDVCLSSSDEHLAPVTAAQGAILRKMGVSTAHGAGLADAPDLTLDAILGYGQSGAPQGEAARLIAWASGRRVLSLDAPSGLELSNGRLHDPHIRAAATLTLALPNEGLRGSRDAVGDLFLADISVPATVYEQLSLPYRTPFDRGPIVRIVQPPRHGSEG